MAFRIVMTSPRGARGLVRVYRKARRAGLRAAAELWFKEILPEHFRPGAEKRYRYKERTKGYLRRKRREGRGNLPLVYTGTLREKMLGKAPRFRFDKQGLSLVWSGLPRYTYITDTIETVRKKDGTTKTIMVRRPNKPAEITAMTKADAERMSKAFQEAFDGTLAADGYGPRTSGRRGRGGRS